MTDRLKDLDDPKWRGFEFPIKERSLQFSQRSAKHTRQYRDGSFIESTGTENRVFSYTIPMRDAAGVGFDNAVPFEAACRDRSEGTLVDPIYGEIIAKVTSYNESLTAGQRDGVDVTVTFEEQQTDDPDSTESDDFAAVNNDATLLDQDVELVDWEQELPPEPTVNPLDAISGVGSQINQAGNQFAASLEDIAFRAGKVERQLDTLTDPKNEPVRRSARRVRARALSLSSKLSDPVGVVRQVALRYGKTLLALLRELRITSDEFRRLNPKLAGKPLIPAGSVVNYYAKENSDARS